MSDMPYLDQQLEFVQWIAAHRTEPLNVFFRFLNFFDTAYFGLVLIPLVWIGFSYRWGLRLFYLTILNSMANGFLKLSIGWPRPNQLVDNLGLFNFDSPGFPSGGAQTALLFGGLLIVYWKNRWSLPLALAYIFLISFSRIYLGVHFPIDILGGWAAGFILLYLFVQNIEQIERFLQRKGLYFSLFLSLAIPLLLLALKHDAALYGALGVGLGTFFSLKYGLFLSAPKSALGGIIRALFGVATLLFLYLIWPKGYSPSAQYFVMSLWISLAISPLWKYIAK